MILIIHIVVQWLKDCFLAYLDEWEHSVQGRGEEFTKSEKERMLLSAETRLGLRMTGKVAHANESEDVATYIIHSPFFHWPQPPTI